MNKFLMPIWAYLAFITCVCAVPPCPKPLRMVTSDDTMVNIKTPCINVQSISNSSMTYLPITSNRQAQSRSINFRISGLKVIRSSDSFPGRGCAEPVLFVVYARSTPGVRGSTVVRLAQIIDYGSERCSGAFIRKVGGRASVRVPARRLSFSAYGVLAVERNSLLLFGFQAIVRRGINRLRREIIKRVESKRFSRDLPRIISTITRQISSVNKINRPLTVPFLFNKLVGVNALVLVHGLRFRKQPSSCFRRNFPICAGDRSISKGLVVGGRVNPNVWRAEVRVRA